MTARKPRATLIEVRLEAENQRLRAQVEALKDQVRQERERANQHADELAFERQFRHALAQRNSWGMH